MAIDWPASMATAMRGDMWPVSVNAAQRSQFNTKYWVVPRYGYNRAYIQWNNLRYTAALNIEGHLARLRGEFVETKVPHVKYRQQSGTWAGAKTVNGVHASEATVLAVSGGTGTINRGDWIMIDKLSGSPRAYMVTVGGTTSITLAFGLIDALAGGETINYIGDGSTTVIYDTMVLAPGQEIGPANIFPSPSPGLIEPRAVEFVSSS